MKNQFNWALALAAMTFTLSSCSGVSSGNVAPRVVTTPSAASHGAKIGLRANGGTSSSFEDARGLALNSDADFEMWIDPRVLGADRKLAIRLLRLMPAQLRGDFVYVDGRRTVSNRPEMLANIKFAAQHSGQALLGKIPNDGRRRPQNYPPVGGGGGPYLRNYSAQGANAAFGFATIPCDATFTSGDTGFMYFNAYSATSSGSIVDAGLNAYPQSSGGTVQVLGHPFVNNNGQYSYSGWTDENYTYQCGKPIGMLYGTMNGGGMSALLLGYANYDPGSLPFPPQSVNLTHGAWDFFPTPAALTGFGGNWNGMWSTCTTCSVAKMLSISPVTNTYSTSCFGLCQYAFYGANAIPNARWDEVVFGNLDGQCTQQANVSATCYYRYPGLAYYYGGLNSGKGGAPTGIYIKYSDPDQNVALEGIAATGVPTSTSDVSVSTFPNTDPNAVNTNGGTIDAPDSGPTDPPVRCRPGLECPL